MTRDDLEERLQSLGLELPEAPQPIAAYVPSVEAGGLVCVSGQLPLLNGKLVAEGPVGSAEGIELAQLAARQCVLNGLAVLDQQIQGDWSRFVRTVRVGVFVQSTDPFTEQAKVANGASELLQSILGEAGRHARAAVGVNSLPLNASVEIEFLFQVK